MVSARPPALARSLYTKATWRKKTTKKEVYLTFDDGPVPEVTPWTLDVLKNYEAKATFFCIGENIVKHRDIFKNVLNAGHAIGNHTFNHMVGWKSGNEDYKKNIEAFETEYNTHLFRPPHGKMKLSQYRFIKKKYDIVMWDVLSGDYNYRLGRENCLQRCKQFLRPGSIVLFHDSLKAFFNLEYVLPRFLDYLKENNYQCKSLLEDEAVN